MFLQGGSGIALEQDQSDPKLTEAHRKTLIDLSELSISSLIGGDAVLSLCAG